MGLEIERKYLVRHLPVAEDELSASRIRQGYVIATPDGIELRVRHKQDRFFQTIKIGEGLSRKEIELELTEKQFRRLWPFTKGRRVIKTRHRVPVGDHTAELDRFDGDLKGLLLVEVEFASVEESLRFIPPEWFGTEVTEDSRYQNKRLAVQGIPQR